ncbi:hypothetical protein Ocin01_12742 [Orchesella cincta]|uniref:Uncharacterized protein n=1 Tax=Orchesella cincta TaxID=48709 RepID=A0A1D2MM58_ORCCI|nr:hypothetical protein Ocin01_12742 [Orchesella cincta]
MSRSTSLCHISASVDGIHFDRWTLAGSFTLLSSNRVTVAGYDTLRPLNGIRGVTNFIGCLKKVISSLALLSGAKGIKPHTSFFSRLSTGPTRSDSTSSSSPGPETDSSRSAAEGSCSTARKTLMPLRHPSPLELSSLTTTRCSLTTSRHDPAGQPDNFHDPAEQLPVVGGAQQRVVAHDLDNAEAENDRARTAWFSTRPPPRAPSRWR